MKGKKIQLLIKIIIPIVIIGASFGAYILFNNNAEKAFEKVVVVNDDSDSYSDSTSSLEVLSKEAYGDIKGFSKNYGFINDDEILIGVGLSKEEFYEKYPDEIDKMDDELYWKADSDKSGEVYKYNLINSEKKPFDVKVNNMYSVSISTLGKYAYLDEDKISIFDTVKNKKTNYIGDDIYYDSGFKIKPESSEWSKDGSTLIYYYDGNLILYNVKEDVKNIVKVDDGESHVSVMPRYYSEDGKEVYFIGVKYTKNLSSQGIYKVNVDSESVEEVFSLPYHGNTSNDYSKYSGISDEKYCVLDEGKRIMFGGIIEGVDGTYIYNVEEGKFHNVITHKVKSEEGLYGSDIWVSPDKTKVIYINLALQEDGKEGWDLYAANINGNSLTNRICIYKNIELCERNIVWSKDSKKILFFTTDNFTMRNYINFADKNEINIITFK